MLALEDEPGDILRKAMKGNRLNAAELAKLTGIAPESVIRWSKADACDASQEEASALATALGLDPVNFGDSVARRWRPLDVIHPHIHSHVQAPHPSNGYIFFLDSCQRAILVDPAGDAELILRALRMRNYHLQYILVTHKHDDHCDAVAEISTAYPDARIVMHPIDAPALGNLEQSVFAVKDGDELPLGDGNSVRALHTPGHTDGSVCYFMHTTLFSGDTLFAGSVGGAYGTHSTYDDILTSIESRLFILPDSTHVMPGHGPPTTIRQEQEHNPFFARHS